MSPTPPDRSPPAACFAAAAPAAVLSVRGADAATFLQGQFTNDLSRAQPRAAIYGLWLNHKGRVLADSVVLACAAERFEIVSATSPATSIRERLEAYIVADDVTVEDRTEACAGFVVAGIGAERVLEAMKLATPGPGTFSGDVDGVLVFRSRLASGPSWHVVGPAAAAAALGESLRAAAKYGLAREAQPFELAALRIEAGVPVVPAELGPGDLPGEGGLDDEAISYTKGCYLGQEVMSRLRNLGQVRRRLFVVRWIAAVAPAVVLPASLHLGGRVVGELRSLVPGRNGPVGLAMLQLGAVQPGTRLAIVPDGAPVVEAVRVAEGRAG